MGKVRCAQIAKADSTAETRPLLLCLGFTAAAIVGKGMIVSVAEREACGKCGIQQRSTLKIGAGKWSVGEQILLVPVLRNLVVH